MQGAGVCACVRALEGLFSMKSEGAFSVEFCFLEERLPAMQGAGFCVRVRECL